VPRRVVVLLFLAAVLASGACRPRPPVVVAMEPRPNPPTGSAAAARPADSPRERLRQNRWLAQFWEELTPAQRRRVERRMRRTQPPIASDGESAGVAWDGLGLAERDRLVFGGGGGGGAVPSGGRTSAATAGADAGRPAASP
jgi:hypothetical protein